jgi:hypothetical protein
MDGALSFAVLLVSWSSPVPSELITKISWSPSTSDMKATFVPSLLIDGLELSAALLVSWIGVRQEQYPRGKKKIDTSEHDITRAKNSESFFIFHPHNITSLNTL